MSTRKKAISGTIWTSTSAITQALVSILRLSILTRFLEKSDFGLVAIVVLVLGFTRIFADLGVSISLFSRENITKKEYSSLYWVSLLLALGLYIVLILSSPLIATFYELPELRQLIPLMALDLVISTAGRQFRIFKQKALQFKLLALIDIIVPISSLVIATILAMKGFGVYSLVFSTLFSSFVSTILLIVAGTKSHPLSFYINLKEGSDFYKIGFYQTGSQILDYIAAQIDIIIIGKLMPVSELGVYNLIKQLITRIYGVINPILTSVAIPILAKFQNEDMLLKQNYLKMISLVAVLNFGAYALVAIFGENILYILYGESYVDSKLILQILCIWGAMASIGGAASTLVVVKGRTDIGFRWTIIRVLTNPIFIFGGFFYGFLGIVIAQAVYMLIVYAIYWKVVVNKIISLISFKDYMSGVMPLFFKTAVLTVVVIYFSEKYHSADGYQLFIEMATGFLVFTSVYIMLNRKTFFELLSFKKKKQIIN